MTAAKDAVEAVEYALRRTSRLLVTATEVGFEDVLAEIGRTLGAEFVLYTGASDPSPVSEAGPVPPAPTYLLGREVVWSSTERDADGGGGLAVPLLVGDDRYIGHLEIGPSTFGDLSVPPCDRLLSVLGDLLVTHLARLAHDEARTLTEDRWRRLVERHPDPTVVLADGVLTYANEAAAVLFGVVEPDDLVGRRLEDFLSAEDVTRVSDARSAQVAHSGAAPFTHEIIRTDGAVRHVESISVPFPGADSAVQTVLRDLTDRRASEDRYRTFVQLTSDGVWRVRLDPPIPRTASVREMADAIFSRGRFAELNPAMARTLGYQRRLPVDAPVGAILGSSSRRPARTLVRALARALVYSGYDLHAFEVTAPRLGGETRHFSVNAVGRFEGDALSEVWGSCTDISERVEMERRLVTVLEEQQERIGRDLHDSVGQLLTGVRMLSDGVAARASGGAEADVALKIAGYASEALDRVREICRGLVPPQLYSEGAAGAIAELVEHVDALGRTRCIFHHDGVADIPDVGAALQAYRVVQEAISNALRHADPKTVWVTLGQDGPDVVVEIEDDGSGFDPDAARSQSLGLYGMARRAGSVGGTLAVESAAGAGTTVRATFSTVAPSE